MSQFKKTEDINHCQLHLDFSIKDDELERIRQEEDRQWEDECDYNATLRMLDKDALENEDFHEAYKWWDNIKSCTTEKQLLEIENKHSAIIRRMLLYPAAHKVNQMLFTLKHSHCFMSDDYPDYTTPADIQLQYKQAIKDSLGDRDD